jgi:glycosyltransferase involved in cell wall biosynthesis
VATINIVVPPLQRHKFSGGILCIFHYASGLRARGHEVNILPLLPSPRPHWFDGDFGNFGQAMKRERCSAGNLRDSAIRRARDVLSDLAVAGARWFHADVQRGLQLRYLRATMCEADVTLATSFETALPVYLYGSGRLCYFMQHFEPYFAIDLPDPKWAEHEARNSYRLGLNLIANSSWLRATVQREIGVDAVVCTNAIDHRIYSGQPKDADLSDVIRVISYGGGQCSWKGFREMAAAVRLVRERLPHRTIKWLVYGDCLLPPDNDIAPYESLGFLQPADLARAYGSADILLSAAWYESFPLYPLEAMACGLPVITTQPGTEEFARAGDTAEVVRPNDVASIAAGLQRLIENREYRSRLARNGWLISREFSWDAAVTRMEQVLLG